MAETTVDVSKYEHSPVHKAIATKDYASLRKILGTLPRLSDPSEISTEAASIVEEEKAEAISAVIDRRDNVPNRDTPLHLAVKLGDETASIILMKAGADWSLQNDQGWSALQEAICSKHEAIVKIIVRYYQPLARANWCRRLPRLVATMRRVRDFYTEITYNFESSVIPFISRIAPSDTFKIWKRGANFRFDWTLVGFDGLRYQHAHWSVMFLGDGSEDGKLPPGTPCVISHKDKEYTNAFDGAAGKASEAVVRQALAELWNTEIIRPGIDVTEAVILPQLTWRRGEKTGMVGQWKAKVYEMHNFIVSLKTKNIPRAMKDDKFLNSCNGNKTNTEELNGILSEEERKQLEVALKMDSSDEPQNKKSSTNESGNRSKDGGHEDECKMGFRPIIWLSPSFPLRTEDLLPLLDILANKVKAICRLRELLTTKLPMGTFPIKVAIPLVRICSLVVTFTKFEELQPLEELSTPPSRPNCDPGNKSTTATPQSSSSSWFRWMIGSNYDTSSSSESSSSRMDITHYPFTIPSDYVCITAAKANKKNTIASSVSRLLLLIIHDLLSS